MITRICRVGICLVVAWVGVASASILDSLTAEQQAELNAGQDVVTSKDIEGGVWPELTVYTKVNAPVQTVASVFQDYDNAQSYQPNLVSAKVIERPSKNVNVVEYTSKLPLFGTTSYTVENTFSESGGGVTVKWKLLKSDMADISDGSLRVEKDGDGSVLRYTNYVKPKSGIAAVAKGAARSEVLKTVSYLKAEAERRAGN